LTWPAALMAPEFSETREKLTSLLPEAVRQASAENRIDGTTYTGLGSSTQRMQQLLRERIKDTPPNQFIEGRRFLSKLEDSVKVLGRPDVQQHLNHASAPNGYLGGSGWLSPYGFVSGLTPAETTTLDLSVLLANTIGNKTAALPIIIMGNDDTRDNVI